MSEEYDSVPTIGYTKDTIVFLNKSVTLETTEKSTKEFYHAFEYDNKNDNFENDDLRCINEFIKQKFNENFFYIETELMDVFFQIIDKLYKNEILSKEEYLDEVNQVILAIKKSDDIEDLDCYIENINAMVPKYITT